MAKEVTRHNLDLILRHKKVKKNTKGNVPLNPSWHNPLMVGCYAKQVARIEKIIHFELKLLPQNWAKRQCRTSKTKVC
jgi:hypothetical protein